MLGTTIAQTTCYSQRQLGVIPSLLCQQVPFEFLWRFVYALTQKMFVAGVVMLQRDLARHSCAAVRMRETQSFRETSLR